MPHMSRTSPKNAHRTCEPHMPPKYTRTCEPHMPPEWAPHMRAAHAPQQGPHVRTAHAPNTCPTPRRIYENKNAHAKCLNKRNSSTQIYITRPRQHVFQYQHLTCPAHVKNAIATSQPGCGSRMPIRFAPAVPHLKNCKHVPG